MQANDFTNLIFIPERLLDYKTINQTTFIKNVHLTERLYEIYKVTRTTYPIIKTQTNYFQSFKLI